jgi:hypothetical protein
VWTKESETTMPENQECHAKPGATPKLPPGVTLLRVLKGHRDTVTSVAFDPQGRTLASGAHPILTP